MRSARLSLATLAVALALAAPTPAGAQASASWQFAPALAPPTPAGTQPSSRVPLGRIGDISFWSPNRGLLIEEGTSGCVTTTTTAGVPCGLYAYDGRSWHLLSTVCGSGVGRIAWAGPDEFWTISDQRPGQLTRSGVNPRAVSLCHFLNGKVVGSYATPFNQPNSYQEMDAAACLAPNNCWFGGVLGVPPNSGAFHLHWDGQTVSAVYSPFAHAVTSMALADQSTLLESIELNQASTGDSYTGESTEHPFLLHQIDPPGSNEDFHPLLLSNPACEALTACPVLPDYAGVSPESLGGFILGSDYSPATTPTAAQVWAAAPSRHPGSAAHPIVLRLGFHNAAGEACDPSAAGQVADCRRSWKQVVGVADPGLREEEERSGRLVNIAAEPGSPDAWLTFRSADGEAHVDRLTAAGGLEKHVLGEEQHEGKRGSAESITCPAPEDCWLGTDEGWLFHLTRSAAEPDATESYPEDEDPFFKGVIAFRPPDEGVPQLPSIEPPADTSGADQLPTPVVLPKLPTQAPATAQGPLIKGLRSKVVRGSTLELTFRLVVRARVQLVALRRDRRVAQTPRKTLAAGKRKLLLRLNPRRWPTRLDLKATPLAPLPSAPAGTGGGQAKPPPLGSNSFST